MKQKYDLGVIGGGLAGLTTALAATCAGMRVVVYEKRTIGAGASGGLVGALAPHMPENWNPKKQYQFDAALAAADYWAGVDALSNLSSGYKRNGRLQAITDNTALDKARNRETASETSWQGKAHWRVKTDANHPFDTARMGYVYDDLSAQIMPRDAVQSLAGAVCAKNVEIHENTEMDAQNIPADRVVIASGFEAWPVLRPYLGENFGEGTKGQAALITPPAPWRYPMVTGDGFYIVPHAADLLAVGSTSERHWKHLRIDQQLDGLLARVYATCPELAGSEIVETWCGVRPRAYRPDPLVGRITDRLFVNGGGFKTGFSFAPKIADDLITMLNGDMPDIPAGFLPQFKV